MSNKRPLRIIGWVLVWLGIVLMVASLVLGFAAGHRVWIDQPMRMQAVFARLFAAASIGIGYILIRRSRQ